MRYSTLAFIGAVAAAPAPQFDIGALLGGLGGAGGAAGGAGGLDLGALLGSLGGGKAGGAPGGGIDFGAILGSLGGASSGPAGDVQVIIGSYGKIKDKVTELDAYVSKITDPAPADVISQIDKLTQAQVVGIQEATKAVDGMVGAIALTDALSLQSPGGDLTVATQNSIDNLKKFKPTIVKVAGAKDSVIKGLNSLVDATKIFNEAVNKKLPGIAVAVATGEGQKSIDALNDAIAEYNKA